MAISRVTGPILTSNLDRQGIDLQFTTNSEPLLYLDFANFQVAINANTTNATETLTINGNLRTSNLKLDAHTITSDSDLTIAYSGNLSLGNVSNIKMLGGNVNYLLSTDGNGNLAWQDLNTLSSTIDLTADNILLGNSTDGSVVEVSAYRRWTANTTVTDAADNLNQVMLNVYQNTYVGNVNITANTASGPSPLSIQFTGTVLGNPNSYYWDFGDGNTSVVQNPTHTYDNAAGGPYSVYFKAYNTNGTLNGAGYLGSGSQGAYFDTLNTDFVTVYTPAPIPAFILSDTSIDDGSSIQLTNTSQHSISYEINWGDGQSDLVTNNSSPGGVSGGPISHTYNNTSGDTEYYVTLDAYSPTAGATGLTVTSLPTNVEVYSSHVPVITSNVVIGNNQHEVAPYGLTVGFNNITSSMPGATSIFANNRYEFNFGDSTVANVVIGSGSNGDTGQVISHTYTLIDPEVQQTFSANLKIFNGKSNSPFTSIPVNITVNPAPTSLFSATASVVSDRTGDTSQTGYLFTDLNGINRAQFVYTNQSFNTDTYTWFYGDSTNSGQILEGNPGSPTGSTITHSYTSTGNKTVSLLATGPNSISAGDDDLTKTNYLSVLVAPLPPVSVGNTILSMGSIGTAPLIAASVTNNSTISSPAAGTTVTRITSSTATTNAVTGIYNSASGSMYSIYNGIADAAATLTTANVSGTYGSLRITNDYDVHSISPAIYPSNFYQVFDGYLTTSGISVGHNTYQLTHSTAGSTPVLSFVRDNVTSVPLLDISTVAMSTLASGSLKYVSGVPYYTTGGTITITGVKAYNWVGQCYVDVTNPLTIHPSTVLAGSGSVINTQNKTYSDLDGAVTYLSGGIPLANTGYNSSNKYSFGSLTVNINGNAAVTGRINLQLSNVNGISSSYVLPTPINLYSTSVTGIDELSIPVSPILGSHFTDNGRRIVLTTGIGGANPAFSNIIDYYTTAQFAGMVSVTGTDEAITRFGQVLNDNTDYSTYLPAGPDLSSRTGTQYFRFAFHRQTVADFSITYSGKISGMWIAAPGTQIDTTSTLNGWIDASAVYAGAGIPGANAYVGGNGSNGCAKTSGDVISVGTTVTNKICTLTLGSENTSNATANQILVTVAIAAGDSLTSVSVS